MNKHLYRAAVVVLALVIALIVYAVGYGLSTNTEETLDKISAIGLGYGTIVLLIAVIDHKPQK